MPFTAALSDPSRIENHNLLFVVFIFHNCVGVFFFSRNGTFSCALIGKKEEVRAAKVQKSEVSSSRLPAGGAEQSDGSPRQCLRP